jgi:DnaJ-class molecular chaperone
MSALGTPHINSQRGLLITFRVGNIVFAELIHQFWGTAGMGGFPGAGMNGGPEPKRDKPVEHDLNVNLEDLYSGTTKKMKIHRKVCRPSSVVSC